MTGQHRMHRNLKLPSILNTLVAKMHVTLSQLAHEFRSNYHRPEGFRHRIWALMERGKNPCRCWQSPLIQTFSPFQDFGCAWPMPVCSLQLDFEWLISTFTQHNHSVTLHNPPL